jgi:hypothetical protein
METEKIGNKGLLWYIENNKTVIEPLRILSVEEAVKQLLESKYPYVPPTAPKIPKRVPKRKK